MSATSKPGPAKKAMSAKEWLRANGYADAAQMIDEVEARWAAAGRKTRRNWWEPRAVAGVTFPVVPEARVRQSRLVSTEESAEVEQAAVQNDATVAIAASESVGRMPDAAELAAAEGLVRRAAQEGRLIPLVGAGASMSSPFNLPGWGELVRKMADHAHGFQASRGDLIRDEVVRGDLIGAATLYCQGDRVPKTERRAFFERTLQVPANETTEAYRIVAGIPFRHCVTTNFDNGLKYAIAAHAAAGAEVEEVRYPGNALQHRANCSPPGTGSTCMRRRSNVGKTPSFCGVRSMW